MLSQPPKPRSAGPIPERGGTLSRPPGGGLRPPYASVGPPALDGASRREGYSSEELGNRQLMKTIILEIH